MDKKGFPWHHTGAHKRYPPLVIAVDHSDLSKSSRALERWNEPKNKIPGLFIYVHWRIWGRGRARRTPPWDPILSFSHTFSPKSTHIRGRRSLTGSRSPMGNPGSATDVDKLLGESFQNFTVSLSIWIVNINQGPEDRSQKSELRSNNFFSLT